MARGSGAGDKENFTTSMSEQETVREWRRAWTERHYPVLMPEVPTADEAEGSRMF